MEVQGTAAEQFNPQPVLSRWCDKCVTQRRPSVKASGPQKEATDNTTSGSAKRTLPQSDVIESVKKLLREKKTKMDELKFIFHFFIQLFHLFIKAN